MLSAWVITDDAKLDRLVYVASLKSMGRWALCYLVKIMLLVYHTVHNLRIIFMYSEFNVGNNINADRLKIVTPRI